MQTQRALLWGIWTWVGNAAGCLLGMIPIALPISVVATIATLITGLGAMFLGAHDRRVALGQGDPDAARDARLGFWLGASHMIIVAIVVAVGYAVVELELLGDALGR